VLSALDVIIIIFILGGAFLGSIRGIVAEVIALSGVLVGLLLAAQFYQPATAALEPILRDHEIALFIGFMAMFLIAMAAFFVVYLLVKSTMADKTPGSLNRFCAALVGGAKNAIFITAMVFLIIFLWSPDNSFTSSSRLLPKALPYCRPLVQLMPQPMQEPLREYLNDLIPAPTVSRKGV